MNLLPAIVSSGAAAAAGIAAWGAVAPSSELFGPTVRRTSSSRKIALTFDDGPNPAVTPQLLELFDRYSVRATFFLIGKFARACPELVKEISARGHLHRKSFGHACKSVFSIARGNSRRARAVPGCHRRCRSRGTAALDAASVRLQKPFAARRNSPRGNAGRRDVVENLLGLETAAARAPDREALERRAPGPAARRHRRAARRRSSRPRRRPPSCRRRARTLASALARRGHGICYNGIVVRKRNERYDAIAPRLSR